MLGDTVDAGEDIYRQNVQFQYHKYFGIFLCIYIGSYLLPVTGLMLYLFLIFKPFFLGVSDFIVLLTSFDSLLIFLTFPLVIIGAYLVQLFFLGVFTKIFWRYTEKKSPTKDGVIPRDISSKTLDY